MPPPSDKTQLNSFIGMCNYLMNYLPHLSDVILPLRGLVKKRTQFTLNRTYDNAFNSAKEHIKNACTLRYFEPSEPIVVECNASKTGIGGVLLQNGPTSDVYLKSSHKNTTEVFQTLNMSC